MNGIPGYVLSCTKLKQDSKAYLVSVIYNQCSEKYSPYYPGNNYRVEECFVSSDYVESHMDVFTPPAVEISSGLLVLGKKVFISHQKYEDKQNPGKFKYFTQVTV